MLDQTSIDILPVTNAKHEDDKPLFFDGVNDPILADAKPVEAFVGPGQWLALERIHCEDVLRDVECSGPERFR